MSNRRSFLKIGVLGALTLAAGGAIYRVANPPQPGRFILDGEARSVLAAVVSPMIGSAMLPADPAARAAAEPIDLGIPADGAAIVS